jgi:hypothetical protein
MDKVELKPIQYRITIVWFGFAAIMFLRCVMITSGNSFVSDDTVWSWYSTSIVPTSGLIFGLWLSVAHDNNQVQNKINKMTANLAQGIVIFYILMVCISISFDTVFKNGTPQAHLTNAQQWLAIIQAPMLALLGKAFFVKN